MTTQNSGDTNNPAVAAPPVPAATVEVSSAAAQPEPAYDPVLAEAMATDPLDDLYTGFQSSLQVAEEGTPAEPQPNPNSQQTGTNGAETSAANGTQESEPTQRPASAEPPLEDLLNRMMGFEQQQNAPQAQPAAQAPQPQAQPAQQPEPAQAQEWTPFAEAIAIPDELADAMFNSQDPNRQRQALGVLLAAQANTVAKKMLNHIQQTLAPAFQSELFETMSRASTAASIYQDFYGKYPELVQAGPIVERAANVVLGADGAWTPETRDRIAELTKAAIARMSGQPVAQAPAAQPAPAAEAAPFVTGSSRPAPAQPQAWGPPEDLASLLW